MIVTLGPWGGGARLQGVVHFTLTNITDVVLTTLYLSELSNSIIIVTVPIITGTPSVTRSTTHTPHTHIVSGHSVTVWVERILLRPSGPVPCMKHTFVSAGL